MTSNSTDGLPQALKNLAQLLKTEEDLDKVSTLRAQLLTEKSSVEIELKSKSQVQIDALLNKISQLNIAQDELKSLKAFVMEINQISQASFKSIDRFELINKMTKIHEIFDMVTSIADRIASFSNELDGIDGLIEAQDYENVDIDHEVADLLEIHFRLSKLLDFKDQILEMSKFSSEDSRFIVKRLFTKIDPVVKKFDVLISNIIEGVVESVKINNNSLVIRLAKIIEFEEVEDFKISQKKKVLLKSANTSKPDKIIFEQIINGTITGRINERNYKDFFLDKIGTSVKDIFQNCWETFDSTNDTNQLFEILNNLDWVFSDLKCIQQDLTQLVPSNWNIFKVYYDYYYKELNNLINKLISKEPETYFILEILEFDSKFKEIMKNEFGMNDVVTVIGEDSKNQLLDDYLNLIIMKMEEWITSLKKTEQESFKSRLSAPDQDSEKLYGLKGSQIVFQMFTQQCDVASGSGQGKILDGVIKKFSELLIQRQNEWSVIIQKEVSRLILSNNKDPKVKQQELESNINDEVPPGLIEYLIALGNDQMRGADYTEAISNKYGSMVSKKYQTSIHENLEKVIDGFADLAKQSCDALIVIIFDDLKTPFEQILSKDWYSKSSNHSQAIIDTIYEYLGELSENLNKYLFEILSEEILEETILKYLSNLKKTNLKVKDTEKFLALVKQDFENFYKIFIKFISKDVIEEKFKILEDFLDLVTIDDNEDHSVFIEIWESLLVNFNDIPLTFFESSLKLNKKLDSSSYKILVSKASLKQKSFLQQNQYDLKQTFMGRF